MVVDSLTVTAGNEQTSLFSFVYYIFPHLSAQGNKTMTQDKGPRVVGGLHAFTLSLTLPSAFLITLGWFKFPETSVTLLLLKKEIWFGAVVV